MTKDRLNEHKENMDKITERLGGTRDDIWQDRFIYDIALAISDLFQKQHGRDACLQIGVLDKDRCDKTHGRSRR